MHGRFFVPSDMHKLHHAGQLRSFVDIVLVYAASQYAGCVCLLSAFIQLRTPSCCEHHSHKAAAVLQGLNLLRGTDLNAPLRVP